MKEYIRHTDKPNAPATIIVTMPFVSLIMVGGLVLSAVQALIYQDFGIAFIVGILAGITCAIWGTHCDSYYNFYENGKLQINKELVKWIYNLNSQIVSSYNKQVVFSIKDIKKVKVHKDYCEIWGSITKTAPFKEPKELSKCKVMIDFKERDEIVSRLQEMARR